MPEVDTEGFRVRGERSKVNGLRDLLLLSFLWSFPDTIITSVFLYSIFLF